MSATPRPWSELRPTGLLWLINTTVFHPRGYALAVHLDDDGTATGWSLMGDGSEPWQFSTDPDAFPEGETVDDAFNAASGILIVSAARPQPGTPVSAQADLPAACALPADELPSGAP